MTIMGTRPSALARRQTELVDVALREAWPKLTTAIRVYTTDGDRELERSLAEIGGKGLFTSDIEQALRAGEIDLAVHSLKDLPIAEADGLIVGAILPRAMAGDVFVSRHRLPLAQLPPAPRIGTCSPRRAAQLLAARPDALILPLRGNIDTRLRKAHSDDYDGIVLAAAGLARLGIEAEITEWLSLDIMLPAPAQGALAIQCRATDQATLALVRPLHDRPTGQAVTAERAFLAALGGGCAAPIAAHAVEATRAAGALDEPRIWLRGLVASPVAEICGDRLRPASGGAPPGGRRVIRVSGEGPAVDPEALGRRLAQQALQAGAAAILEGA